MTPVRIAIQATASVIVAAAMAGGSLVLTVAPAQAAPIASVEASVSGFPTLTQPVTINDSTSDVTLTNYGQTAGNSGYNGAVGGQAFNFAGNGGVAELSLDPDLTVPTYTSGLGTLTTEMTQTGLTATGDKFLIQPEFDGIFHTHADTATYSLYYDPNNAAFGTTDLLYQVTETNPNPPQQFTFNVNQSFIETLTAPFSITEVITFTGPASSGGTNLVPHLDGEVDISAVPEPPALLLFGSGVLALGFLLTQRRAAR